jgi:hypothetical protein
MITKNEQQLLSIIGATQVLNLPRASWTIGTRALTTHLTVHYNGPAVPSFGNIRGELDQIRSDARWHMRPGAFGVPGGADGIQYHGGTLSDGSQWRFRDLQDMLWHCGNAYGNKASLAWHLPLGGKQVPTSKQLRALFYVFNAARIIYGIKHVNIVGHREWKSTECPGTIFPSILDYRNKAMYNTPIVAYKTTYNANCREAPDVNSAIALNGQAVYPAGTIFAADEIKENGVPYNGNPVYVHRADGVGFFHITVVAPAGDVDFAH